MAKVIVKEMLERTARVNFHPEIANYICEAAAMTEKVDAIPVYFIARFMKDRDPVYKSNLTSMIKAYNEEVGDSDRIPEEIFK